MILELAAGSVAIPLAAWTLNKLVQHDRDIAVLKQVASDIRDSLQHLERLLERTYAEDQSRSHSR